MANLRGCRLAGSVRRGSERASRASKLGRPGETGERALCDANQQQPARTQASTLVLPVNPPPPLSLFDGGGRGVGRPA